MKTNLRTTVVATGLALAFSLYAQQPQTGSQSGTQSGTGSQSGAQSGTGSASGTGQSQTGRGNAASSSRNRIEEPKSMVGPAEQRFMNEAAAGGMAEVHMAQVAQKQAQSDQVKSLAQKIEQDHTQANNELKALADKRGVSLPASPDPKHQATMDRLSKLQGAAFDRAYARHMVSEHRKDISKFERASNNLMDTDLKNFASKTLPNLREHLRMAQEAAGQKASAAKADNTPTNK
jgi:putative membrane protein